MKEKEAPIRLCPTCKKVRDYMGYLYAALREFPTVHLVADGMRVHMMQIHCPACKSRGYVCTEEGAEMDCTIGYCQFNRDFTK